jgi:hypothetical protein
MSLPIALPQALNKPVAPIFAGFCDLGGFWKVT